MAQPFSSSRVPSSSCVPRRPPPSAFSPPPRKSASHVAVYGPRRRAVTATASLHLGPGEIAELARNKVGWLAPLMPAGARPNRIIVVSCVFFNYLLSWVLAGSLEGFDCRDGGERDRAAVQALHLGHEMGRRRRRFWRQDRLPLRRDALHPLRGENIGLNPNTCPLPVPFLSLFLRHSATIALLHCMW